MMALLLAVLPALADKPCGGCHALAHEQWARSRHAAAYTNPAFQAAWSRWRDPWCTSCHQPEGGVDCADCHLQQGLVATPWSPSARGRAVHDMVVVPDLGTRACVRCHQFNAPGGGGAVQTTGSEHAAWQAGSGSPRRCADCHGGGHAVPPSRDPERLRQALSVAVWRDEASVQATVTARGIGHRFPTGDPWRRLILEILDGEEITARWTLSRRVAGVDADFHEVSDKRLPLPGPDGLASKAWRTEPELGASRWRLTYERVDPDHTELPPEERGFVVAEGVIEDRIEETP